MQFLHSSLKQSAKILAIDANSINKSEEFDLPIIMNCHMFVVKFEFVFFFPS